jgi:hypothetical protein
LADGLGDRGHNRAPWRSAGACLAGLALLSACAQKAQVTTQAPALSPPQEAAIYKSHAHASYAPPGPPEDPWGPYIREASHRFDVPDAWIREVMNVESGGYEYRANGELTTSPVGAMGLMQLMPETYDEMKVRYGLTDDAFEPHNNILAGTAYLREMYDAFGAPAFLAAYNAGPNRLADYLENHRPLPDETRRYVWLIGSMIQGIYPQSRSPNEQVALNQIPVAIPPGVRYPRHVYAQARTRHRAHDAVVRYASLQHHKATAAPAAAPVEVAEAPEPKAAPVHVASATPTHGHGGMHLITSAYAAESVKIGGTNWAVQVGAFPSRAKAAAAASSAGGMVAHASTAVAAVQSGHATVYRARLSGLTHDGAVHACQKLAHKSGGCLIVSPASQ